MKYVVLPKKNNAYGYCHSCTGGQCNGECTLCRDQSNGGGGGGGGRCVHATPIYGYGGGRGGCDLHSC